MTTFTQTGIKFRDIRCPNCNAFGQAPGSVWQCNDCTANYVLQVYCDTCNNEVHRLKACGGFEEYYCDTCRQPVSRSRVLYVLKEQ